ncbi:MAG: glycosyltransferase, partial [Bacteroidetes bacterium]|nr:glycosyltransferase [Bacteroidota bacterium]
KAHLIRQGVTHHKIEVIPTGVDTEMFTPEPPAAHEGVNVLHLGDIRANSGLEMFIESILHAKETCPEITYTLVGYPSSATFLAALKTQAEATGFSESIIFNPAVSHEKTPNTINNADICVITLPPNSVNHSAFPLRIMEYMACGIPVLSTPLNGVQNAFEGLSSGIVYADYQAEVYGEALGTLAADPDLREMLGQASRSAAELRDWRMVWKEVEGYLEGILEG